MAYKNIMADVDAVDKKSSFSFKKKGKFKGARKRKTESSDEGCSDEETGPVVVKRERKGVIANPLKQTSGKAKAKDKTKVDYGSGGEDEGSATHSYKSSKTAISLGPADMGATATVEVDTALDRDAQAICERSLLINKEQKDKADDKVYRGLNNYAQYIEKRDTAEGNAASGSVRKGPIRAPANLRATVRWDYAPDICKDYKETGFCGFGDSCKFMHDRGDYKHGWQLEREIEEGTYDKEDVSKYEIGDSDDEMPFKCYICRDSFKDPIITKCKHYFCEKCALAQFRKTRRCFVCGENTNGVFNPAKELIKKMKKSEEEKQKTKEKGDDDSSDGSEVS